MQYRARRDAAKAGQMLVYIQAVDQGVGCNLQKADYMRALQIVNYCMTGNRMGILPLFVGMQVRLTKKMNAKFKLVNEKVGTVVRI